jgi:D-alanyl-D-alanine carboxypeptidase
MTRATSIACLALSAGLAALLLFSLLNATANAAAPASDYETKAPFAVLIDFDSGSLMYQKNADQPIEPAIERRFASGAAAQVAGGPIAIP